MSPSIAAYDQAAMAGDMDAVRAFEEECYG